MAECRGEGTLLSSLCMRERTPRELCLRLGDSRLKRTSEQSFERNTKVRGRRLNRIPTARPPERLVRIGSLFSEPPNRIGGRIRGVGRRDNEPAVETLQRGSHTRGGRQRLFHTIFHYSLPSHCCDTACAGTRWAAGNRKRSVESTADSGSAQGNTIQRSLDRGASSPDTRAPRGPLLEMECARLANFRPLRAA